MRLRAKVLLLTWLLVGALSATAVSQQQGPGSADPTRPITVNFSTTCSGGGSCPAGSVAQIGSISANAVCSVSITPSNVFTGTIDFEQSSDGNNWQAVSVTPSTGGTPVTSASGAFIGSTAILAIAYFRARAGSLTGGASVTVNCVPARLSVLGSGPFAGASNSLTAITAGVCITVTSSPGPRTPTVSYSCATPGPTASPNTYDATILAETSATHYWRMNDSPGGATPGPCPSTIADDIAAGATGAPSPVPLTVVASPAASFPPGSPAPIACGAKGAIADGSTSIEFTQLGTSTGLSIPSPVFETLCKSGGGTCDLPFSLECIVVPELAGEVSNGDYFWSIDATVAHGSLGATDGIWATKTGSSSFVEIGPASAGMPVQIVWAYDGAAATYLYINGVLALSTNSNQPTITNATVGWFGSGDAATSTSWSGRLEKCSTYNIMLTQAKVRAHYLATGFP